MKYIMVFENFNDKYPKLKQLKSLLRNNIVYQVKNKVLDAYIIGSEAKGTAKENSDLDIAVIIDPIKGKTALQKTEEYHNKYSDDTWKPKWNGRIIDVQFFYENDPELKDYSKIKLL